VQTSFGAGDADIGQAAFLFQALLACLIHGALGREKPVLPARQEDGRKLQPLGGMERHERDLGLAVLLLIVHDERDVFEETLQVFEEIPAP
jgi:hypothetical protein